MHRLWYDLRAQSLFERSFQADVAEIDQSLERMIWRIVSQFAELAGSPPAISAESCRTSRLDAASRSGSRAATMSRENFTGSPLHKS